LTESLFLFFFFLDKDAGYYSKKIKVVDGVCWYIEISYVAGCLFVPGEVGCGDCALKCIICSLAGEGDLGSCTMIMMIMVVNYFWGLKVESDGLTGVTLQYGTSSYSSQNLEVLVKISSGPNTSLNEC
jgi:hypothetical protein